MIEARKQNIVVDKKNRQREWKDSKIPRFCNTNKFHVEIRAKEFPVVIATLGAS